MYYVICKNIFFSVNFFLIHELFFFSPYSLYIILLSYKQIVFSSSFYLFSFLLYFRLPLKKKMLMYFFDYLFHGSPLPFLKPQFSQLSGGGIGSMCPKRD